MSITNELIKSIEVLPGSQLAGSGTDIAVNVPTRQEAKIRRPDIEELSSQDEFDPWEESLRHYGITLNAE